jgi:cell division septal protein FtsQ
MARRSAELALPAPAIGRKGGLRYVLISLIIILSLILAGVAWSRVEQFLVSDARLILPGPPEPGIESPYFRIEGTVHVSARQIEQVFARDFGRSIYLSPIYERRRQLRGIDWVKEASVARIWPNRLVVRISERVPVAFVQVPSLNHSTRLGLIDSDGTFLSAQRGGKFNLPVLTGVLAGESQASRRERVQRMLRLQRELGSMMDKVSEVDASDIDNLKVTQQFDNRAIVLMLGNQKFAERMQNFLNTADQIRQRMPDAAVLDLRLPDRITAVGGRPRVD